MPASESALRAAIDAARGASFSLPWLLDLQSRVVAALGPVDIDVDPGARTVVITARDGALIAKAKVTR